MGLLIRLAFVLVLVAVVGGGVGSYFLQQKPDVGVPLRSVAPDPAAARALDQKIDSVRVQAEAARREGRSVPVQLTVTEQELTSKAALLFAAPDSPLKVTGVQINLLGGSLIATGVMSFQGFNLNLAVSAKPIAVDGKAQLQIEKLQTGGFPLPDFLKQQLNLQLGQAIDPAAFGVPMSVTSIAVQDGRMTVSGMTK